jgi:6-phosphogluconolactonase (cycloisomerase 2 family)
MSIRFPWLLGLVILVSIALLMACGSHYSASSDGLLIVPSLGSGVVQSFTFNLANGHTSAINTVAVIPGPPAQGAPTSIILDPAGAFAYVTTTHLTNPGTDPCASTNAIATFKVNSNGTLTAIGSQPLKTNPPVALAIDSAGKLLFVAASATCAKAGTVIGPGEVWVFSVGSNASLTNVSGSPFSLPQAAGAGAPNPMSLAVTHTTFPVPGTPAACASQTAPTAEFVYVADSTGDDVVGYTVSSSGVLTPITVTAGVGFATGTTPSGIVVDPCDRFVYVANQGSNNVNAYNICSAIGIGACTSNDWSLVPVSGSPFSAGTSPGPLVVDPFGNFLYVLDTGQSAVSGYKIAQVSGALTALTPATVGVGSQPVSITIRGDDNWLFVTNYISATVSQFIITPASGALTPAGTGIVTDNFPWGVAVK